MNHPWSCRHLSSSFKLNCPLWVPYELPVSGTKICDTNVRNGSAMPVRCELDRRSRPDPRRCRSLAWSRFYSRHTSCGQSNDRFRSQRSLGVTAVNDSDQPEAATLTATVNEIIGHNQEFAAQRVKLKTLPDSSLRSIWALFLCRSSSLPLADHGTWRQHT